MQTLPSFIYIANHCIKAGQKLKLKFIDTKINYTALAHGTKDQKST